MNSSKFSKSTSLKRPAVKMLQAFWLSTTPNLLPTDGTQQRHLGEARTLVQYPTREMQTKWHFKVGSAFLHTFHSREFREFNKQLPNILQISVNKVIITIFYIPVFPLICCFPSSQGITITVKLLRLSIPPSWFRTNFHNQKVL